jgi:hypothetical protein
MQAFISSSIYTSVGDPESPAVAVEERIILIDMLLLLSIHVLKRLREGFSALCFAG